MQQGPNLVEDLNSIQQPLKRLERLFAKNCDIHKHTREIGNICRETFAPIDAAHGISHPQSLEETIAEIRAFTDDKAVNSVLKSIQSNKNTTEEETGLNPADLLCKTWQMAKRFSNQGGPGLVIDNLRHNKTAQGGCLAGICARLIQPYTFYIGLLMKERNQERHGVSPNNVADVPDLEAAILASKEEAEFQAALMRSTEGANYTPAYAAQPGRAQSAEAPEYFDDEEALSFAVALSLQNS